MRNIIIFIYFVVSFLHAQLSSLVAGEYLCEYKISKEPFNNWDTIGISKIWVKDKGPDSIWVIDSMFLKYMWGNTLDSLSYKLRGPYHDTIQYYLSPQDRWFFYGGDSIDMYWRGTYTVIHQKGKRLPVSITPPTYSKLKIYPQPAQNELFVFDLPQGKKVLKLFDLVGKEIWRKESDLMEEVIDLSALQNGMYVLEVECEGKRFTEKVLK